jgi:hypothetical protein
MLAENFAKQIIDFQRATFDNSFDAVVMFQDQTERLFKTVTEQAAWIPEEGKRVLDECATMYKVGRNDFKQIVDDNFDKLAEFFALPETFCRAGAAEETRSE